MTRKMAVVALLVSGAGSGLFVAASPQQDPLGDIIRREQAKNVRKSTAPYAGMCFTDDDLDRFKTSNRVQAIVEGLKKDSAFAKVIEALQAMSSGERQAALAKARRIAQPTWGEMGYVDSSGKGQTDAGQRAQLMIAEKIVQLVQAVLDAK